MRLQFVHADHVVLPSLPTDFVSVGRSDHCALQGIYKSGRVLTFQGHAEFDEWINRETVTAFGKPIWSQEVLEAALEKVKGEDDSLYAARVMLEFFAEEAVQHVESADKSEILVDQEVVVLEEKAIITEIEVR